MRFSLKLSLWFFVCIIIIEGISMIFLHQHVVESLVEEELHALKARGNNHRDVLASSFDITTMEHISQMETHTDTDVFILNSNGEIITSSSPHSHHIRELELNDEVPREGLILQSNWRKGEYLSTVSPYDAGYGNIGYVFMIKKTDTIQGIISKLNHHFLIAAIVITFFMLITIFFLVNVLTKPLNSMKMATEKISKGDFSVTLPVSTKDEVGDLASSIQTLANDLNYLKKERNEFLASISHELRTPLTYIKGYADIAKRKDTTEEERIEYLSIIHEEAGKVHHLLEELFDLAKLDQNMFTINKETTDLQLLLEGIFQKVMPVFLNKNITLELKCENPWKVNIDPKRIEQVLVNLLDNALKYSESGTTTTVVVKKENKNIFIMITDQGIGIPNEDLPYIFNRFYRVEKSRSRLTGGVGLGLSIVKELVEAHHGDISVRSKLDEGTTFTIRLKEK
ncbi:sensor histidine kinase [Bacillus sp. FJAT-45066]|uniref:sensor histidine kinase n=1 Tax=Bacillus sp. FJAT-45066 TaxID=2011010 RepID=UPI0020D01D93|nr:HAMP domain-containing sensor histidine kinase [Bacillus sp. FJAT-45066]